MEFKNYYEILGVSANSSVDEIKRAYRKLARKYHPDVSKLADAESKFKEINEAWEVLGDPHKKQQYDEIKQSAFTPHRAAQASSNEDFGSQETDFSEFFKNIFGQAHSSSAHGFVRKGQDLHTKIMIPLQLAYQGGAKEIGIEIGDHTKYLQIKIPPGTLPHSQIRLKEQGRPGTGGAKAGDLYLEINIESHPYFSVHQKDIYLHLPITPWEAALGSKIEVPTLGGKVNLTIAPNSQNGQKLRLKGKGFPGNPPGDQIVSLLILTPKADSPDAIKLYEQMAHAMPFNPREKLGV